MPDNDSLRRYLRQQQEMGESEIVFDGIGRTEIGGLLRKSSLPDWRESLRDAGVEVDAAKQGAERAASTESDSRTKMKKGRIVDEESELFTGSISESSSLIEIAARVTACKRCPLFETAKNGVPGEGNPNASVVCVGEGPGANEDETGLPFVGAAGNLLTKILESVNLTREEVFITNVVKHRPPENRNPQPEEVAACSPYLIRQLELIKPKVIIAFGNFAAQTLLNTKDGIGKLRGAVHSYHGTPLVVTYHPAALLRNPSWKRPTWEDVKLARRVLDKAAGA